MHIPNEFHRDAVTQMCMPDETSMEATSNRGYHKNGTQKEKDNWVPTLAKNVFTNRYRNRPKSSFRTRIAINKLPKMNAPVYVCGYVQAPEIVEISPITFSTTTKVKNFLREEESQIQWSRMARYLDTCRY